jgi:hypothetical protein
MPHPRSLLTEFRRRNVPRAAVIYIAAAWALSQGIAQLAPYVGAPDWVVRWFLVAAVVAFPLWIAFAWFFELTPEGLKRDSELAERDSAARRATARKLDFWIIGILAVALVLLLTDRLAIWKQDSPAAISDKSIAVLPLANDSGDKDQQYFADGLSEDFINALSQFSGLKVIGRNSAFQFRDTTDTAQTRSRYRFPAF